MKKKYKAILILVIVSIMIFLLQHRSMPEVIQYGVSFSEFRSNGLDLNPKETFDSIVDDLGVRKDIVQDWYWRMMLEKKGLL